MLFDGAILLLNELALWDEDSWVLELGLLHAGYRLIEMSIFTAEIGNFLMITRYLFSHLVGDWTVLGNYLLFKLILFVEPFQLSFLLIELLLIALYQLFRKFKFVCQHADKLCRFSDLLHYLAVVLFGVRMFCLLVLKRLLNLFEFLALFLDC